MWENKSRWSSANLRAANFFAQRCHPDAQPEIYHLAELILDAYRASTPGEIGLGGWRMPLILTDAGSVNVRDIAKDLEPYDRLMNGGANAHWSPTEYVVTLLEDPRESCAIFRCPKQYRKLLSAENAATFPDEIARTG